jgi:transcriptional regulator with XRE-family HTH domain
MLVQECEMSIVPLVRLQEWRERRQLTQTELARRAGVAPSTVARIELGVHRARHETALRLANALDVRFEQLLEWLTETEAIGSGQVSADEPTLRRAIGEGVLPSDFFLDDRIAVETWREGSEYVADAPDLGVHAFGQSEEEAVANLGAQVVERLRRLEELGDRLTPRMTAQRDRLRELLAVAYA